MPHYEKESLDALIERLKAAKASNLVSGAPKPAQTQTPTPTPQQRPKTWEELQLEKQAKSRG